MRLLEKNCVKHDYIFSYINLFPNQSKINALPAWYHFSLFKKNKLEDISPFCVDTDTPVLDFW